MVGLHFGHKRGGGIQFTPFARVGGTSWYRQICRYQGCSSHFAEICPHIGCNSCGECFVCAANAGHNLRMNYGDNLYIWQATDWPQWRYDLSKLAGPLANVSRAQGLLMGRLADVGMTLRDQASLARL